MTDHPKEVLYLWNLAVNSLLAFATLRVLMACFSCLYPFSSRAKATWSLLLFTHLILHPFMYNWMNWADVSPWAVPAGTREIAMTLCLPTSSLQLQHLDGRTFTPADCLADLLPFSYIVFSVCIAFAGSLACLFHFARKVMAERRFYRDLLQESLALTLDEPLSPFMQALKKSGIEVRVSKAILTPCAYGLWKPAIFIPQALFETLSQQELHTILMHEWGHLYYRDIVSIFLCRVVSCLFWWVPTRRALEQLTRWQEEACDDAVHTWRGCPYDLSMALIAAARAQRSRELSAATPKAIACQLTGSTLKYRMKRLMLKMPTRKASHGVYVVLRSMHYMVITFLMLTLVFGKFWAF